jgi:hypothetical protein
MGSLKSSIVLLRAIHKNGSRESITAVFNGDVQLVQMLWSYLQHNYCIELDSNSSSGWKVSGKGMYWINRYGGSPSLLHPTGQL